MMNVRIQMPAAILATQKLSPMLTVGEPLVHFP